jgi:hypothetical protein
VFVRRYAAVHPGSGPVPEPLLAAFRELLDAVQHDGVQQAGEVIAVAAPGRPA